MSPLNLSPIPTLRPDSERGNEPAPEEGFVDEGVVQHLLAGPMGERNGPVPSDLALAADGDFAGWCLASSSLNLPEERQETRRPSPPALEESGIGTPYRGSHRWWIAGIAGALSTLLFTILLISLSYRNPNPAEAPHFSGSAPRETSTPAKHPDETAEPAPVLTDNSPLK